MTTSNGGAIAAARRRYPPMWVVYDHPLDEPDNFVVRLWYGPFAEASSKVVPSLAAARAFIEKDGGSLCIGRMPGDDHAIAEVWL